MKSVFVYEYLSAHGPEALPGLSPADAAGLLQQGREMRDALCADLLQCGLSVGHAAPQGEQRPVASQDEARSVPLLAQPGEAPAALLARAALAHERVWIIAPETDDLLAALSATLPAVRRVGCSLAALRLTSRKEATSRHLAAAGIATPAMCTVLPHDPTPVEPPPRWVVKPDDGAGAVETRVHADRPTAEADLAARRAAGRSATIEPYVEGEALSLSLLCRSTEVELLAINRQRIHLDADGWVRYDGVDARAVPLHDLRAPALRTLARQLKRAITGLGGYVGVDLIWHPLHGPVVIEINPRLTSSWPGLQAALGRPLAAEILAVPVDDGALR